MNRNLKWVFAAALIGSAYVFNACNDEKELTPDEQLTQKILGKWIPIQNSGVEVYTDQKTVTTFEKTASGIKAYTSVSTFTIPAMPGTDQSDTQAKPDEWKNRQEADVTIEDGKILVTRAVNDSINLISQYYILESKGSTMKLYASAKMTVRGYEIMDGAMEHSEVWAKIDVDYSKDIVGLWEGRVTSEESKFDDGEPHRWEYLADGTAKYYSLDNDSNWYEVEDVFNMYFVDGNLLCTRWKNVGENEIENREWWEIESIDADSMSWTAKRLEYTIMGTGINGTPIIVPKPYTASFSMKRVKN